MLSVVSSIIIKSDIAAISGSGLLYPVLAYDVFPYVFMLLIAEEYASRSVLRRVLLSSSAIFLRSARFIKHIKVKIGHTTAQSGSINTYSV
mgnify:CR=1 FL=1